MSAIRAVPAIASTRINPLRAGALLGAFLLLVVSCGTPLGPLAPLPSSAIRFSPPAEYVGWWKLTETCSHRRRQPGGIEWFVIPDVSSFATLEGHQAAQWSRGSNGARIIISGALIRSELVVRHEMLHALLDRGDHPPEYFIDRCHLTWSSWAG